MFHGKIVSIHVAEAKAAPMKARRKAEAAPGYGLKGDRYGQLRGTFTKTGPDGRNVPDHEITLIESEAIRAVQAEKGIALKPGETRRNLVTRGVPLNHLVGKRFKVGRVVLQGLRLCEPCAHLAKLTGKDLIPALLHRGGLRARVIKGGTIHVGDAVRP